MRKTIVIFILTALLFLLASCLPETLERPYGVWMSEEPRIILYLKPEYQFPVREGLYPGLFIKDGIRPEVLVSFGHGHSFVLYDIGGGGSSQHKKGSRK